MISRSRGTSGLVFVGASGGCSRTAWSTSSAEIEPSYVLSALGLSPEEAARSLRIGIGRFTSAADVDFAAAALAAAHAGTPMPAVEPLAKA